jgi:DNA-binding NtrC family response regulator
MRGRQESSTVQPISRPYILLVEPNPEARGILHTAASAFAHVESHGWFDTARGRVRLGSFDFLVTNGRLGAENGLRLVYLVPPRRAAPRAIVYSNEYDLRLARAAQQTGAFYELGPCLPVTLEAYVTGALPDRDRRDPALPDRRDVFRGGRRCWDLHLVRLGRNRQRVRTRR